MQHLKKYSTTFKFLPLIIVIIISSGCTTSVTRAKNPVFAVENSVIQQNLLEVVTCQHINLDGKEVTTNGTKKTAIEIDVTNGKEIPEDQYKMTELGKKIATIIKKALKDQNEYEQYTVLFIEEKSSNGITSRKWKGHDFKTTDL
jgi:hypothetical protein